MPFVAFWGRESPILLPLLLGWCSAHLILSRVVVCLTGDDPDSVDGSGNAKRRDLTLDSNAAFVCSPPSMASSSSSHHVDQLWSSSHVQWFRSRGGVSTDVLTTVLSLLHPIFDLLRILRVSRYWKTVIETRVQVSSG